MQLSGAEIVVQALADEGVEYVWGYPGGAVLHIYDAIFNQEDVRHILVRHEQAATHAADGYARATGKPEVALVTSGPGATNAVTGIATAYMDSIPMVVINIHIDNALHLIILPQCFNSNPAVIEDAKTGCGVTACVMQSGDRDERPARGAADDAHRHRHLDLAHQVGALFPIAR